QLLTVNGTTTGASVVWDIGLPTEQVLTNGLFGTVYFQVPQDAGEGPHPVAIQNAKGASAPVTVTVLPAQPFPEPRIEDVGVLVADGPGPVTLALTVSAANLDVDATVTVVEAAGESSVQRQVPVTVRWGGLS